MSKNSEYYFEGRLVIPVNHQYTDIIPEGYEKEARKALHVGDTVKVVVESCFREQEGVKYKGRIGTLVEEDCDEWGYSVRFEDAAEAIPYNWFKRYHLKKVKGVRR